MANNKPKIIPIERINKWFSGEDFQMEQEFAKEMIEADGNFTVILYKVNREMTSSDDIYGEANMDNIRFFPPVELKVMPVLEEPENKSYNSGSGTLKYLQDGILRFIIMQIQLDELKVELNYGDYIGYPVDEENVRFFSISKDGIKNWDNKHTIMGYKGAYLSVICAPTDPNEFRAL